MVQGAYQQRSGGVCIYSSIVQRYKFEVLVLCIEYFLFMPLSTTIPREMLYFFSARYSSESQHSEWDYSA